MSAVESGRLCAQASWLVVSAVPYEESSMKLYLNSCEPAEIREIAQWGILDGVTTNPSLMTKAGIDPEAVLRGLAELEFHQVYYQLVSRDLDSMLLEAREATEFVKNGLILKIAPTQEGFRFVAKYGNKFPCCVTAIFDPAQALVAREAGAQLAVGGLVARDRAPRDQARTAALRKPAPREGLAGPRILGSAQNTSGRRHRHARGARADRRPVLR